MLLPLRLVCLCTVGAMGTLGATHPKDQMPIEILGISPSPKVSDTAAFLQELTKGTTAPYFQLTDFKRIAALGDGEHVEWWDNGQRKLQITMKNHVPEGHFHAWYPDGGDAFKGFLLNESKLGIHIAFFPSRHGDGLTFVARLFTYNEQGLLSGVQKTLHPHSYELASYLIYKDGVVDGKVEQWDRDERLIDDRVFKKGKLIKPNIPNKLP